MDMEPEERWFEDIVRRIQAAFQNSGYTYDELVRACNGRPGRTTLVRLMKPVEEQPNEPQWSNLARLAKVLGVPLLEVSLGENIIPEVGIVAADSRLPSMDEIEAPEPEDIHLPYGLQAHRVVGTSMGSVVWPGQRVITSAERVEDGDLCYVEWLDPSKVPVVKRWHQEGVMIYLESVDSNEPLLRVSRGDIRFIRKVVGAWYV